MNSTSPGRMLCWAFHLFFLFPECVLQIFSLAYNMVQNVNRWWQKCGREFKTQNKNVHFCVCVCVCGFGWMKKKNMFVCVCVRVFQEQNSNTKRKIIPIHSFQLYTARRDQCGGARSQTRWTQKGKLLFIHVKWHCCFFNIYNLKKKRKKKHGGICTQSLTHAYTHTNKINRKKE